MGAKDFGGRVFQARKALEQRLERTVPQTEVGKRMGVHGVTVGRTYPSNDYHYTLGMTVEALLLAVFLIQMLRLSESPLWSWLNRPVIRWLGAISYPCYLWHGWGLGFGKHFAAHLTQNPATWLQFVAGYAFTIGLASLSYYLIEKPFLALKRVSFHHEVVPSAQTTAAPIP